MALCDSAFKESERAFLYKFAKNEGISKEQLDEIIPISEIGNFEVPKDDEKIGYLYDLCLMIWADGSVNEWEENTLQIYCKRFGFLDKDENIEKLSKYLLDCAYSKIPKQGVISSIRVTEVLGGFKMFEKRRIDIDQIFITHHAEERYRDRKAKASLDSIKEKAIKAFNDGESAFQIKGRCKQNVESAIKKYPRSVIRWYENYLWIFQENGKGTYLLITLYAPTTSRS